MSSFSCVPYSSPFMLVRVAREREGMLGVGGYFLEEKGNVKGFERVSGPLWVQAYMGLKKKDCSFGDFVARPWGGGHYCPRSQATFSIIESECPLDWRPQKKFSLMVLFLCKWTL